MIRVAQLLFAGAVFVVGCRHQSPAAPQVRDEQTLAWHDASAPIPAGTRLAIQINNEAPIVEVADGRGGPLILYHGRSLDPGQLKSLIILKRKEARERFGDQTLDGAILMELK